MAEVVQPSPPRQPLEPTNTSLPRPSLEPSEKHLEFIQAAITRMASSSFLLKGWAVTLATALLGLNLDQLSISVGATACSAIVLFWGLDAYYLYLERAFRRLYDAVLAGARGPSEPVPVYSMDVRAYLGWKPYCKSLFSLPLIIQYGALLGVALTLVWLKTSEPQRHPAVVSASHQTDHTDGSKRDIPQPSAGPQAPEPTPMQHATHAGAPEPAPATEAKQPLEASRPSNAGEPATQETAPHRP